MKSYYWIILLFITLNGNSQNLDKFYDFDGKECVADSAVLYSHIQKTDSGWLKMDYFLLDKSLQKTAMYLDSNCAITNGECITYYAHEKMKSWCRKINNLKEGSCLNYYPNGSVQEVAFYLHDQPVDYRLRFNEKGYLADSTYFLNDSTEVFVNWFDNGNLSSSGYFRRGKYQGPWMFYHSNGRLAASEKYERGKMTDSAYWDDKGNPMAVKLPDRPAAFHGGQNAWGEYVAKCKITKPADRKQDPLITLAAQYYIDEKGRVVDVSIETSSSNLEIDSKLAQCIEQSPDWTPAISHNRAIKTIQHFHVNFKQK